MRSSDVRSRSRPPVRFSRLGVLLDLGPRPRRVTLTPQRSSLSHRERSIQLGASAPPPAAPTPTAHDLPTTRGQRKPQPTSNNNGDRCIILLMEVGHLLRGLRIEGRGELAPEGLRLLELRNRHHKDCKPQPRDDQAHYDPASRRHVHENPRSKCASRSTDTPVRSWHQDSAQIGRSPYPAPNRL